ncbi:MAG: hypothetical protein KJZ59_09905, partial [Pararhodobacter sp.]|nr:hypothetical protein [Pararhodobacter sp.]
RRNSSDPSRNSIPGHQEGFRRVMGFKPCHAKNLHLVKSLSFGLGCVNQGGMVQRFGRCAIDHDRRGV